MYANEVEGLCSLLCAMLNSPLARLCQGCHCDLSGCHCDLSMHDCMQTMPAMAQIRARARLRVWLLQAPRNIPLT